MELLDHPTRNPPAPKSDPDPSAAGTDAARPQGQDETTALRVAVSVVFPVFNEAENLAPLLEEIEQAMAATGLSYEIVAVDDASDDESLSVLEERSQDLPALRSLSTSKRSGQSAALAAGFRAARGDVIVTLDADLQNNPADIPRLLDALEGHDVVSGVRRRRRDSWLRRISSRVANGVRSRVLDDGIRDVGCSLKVYRREVLRDLPTFNGMHRFLPALTRLRGARIRELEVDHRPRRFGESKYGLGNRLLRGIVDLFGVLWLQRRWVDVSDFEER